jgi:hypothetical protein
MSDPDIIIEQVVHARHILELNDLQCDILANILYEYYDEADTLHSFETVLVAAQVVQDMTTIREWVKTKIDWANETDWLAKS